MDRAIVLHPAAPDSAMKVATDVGMFFTPGNSIWYNVTADRGLPNTQVNDLKMVPGQRALFALTWGRGIWKLPIRWWTPAPPPMGR